MLIRSCHQKCLTANFTKTVQIIFANINIVTIKKSSLVALTLIAVLNLRNASANSVVNFSRCALDMQLAFVQMVLIAQWRIHGGTRRLKERRLTHRLLHHV